MGIQRLEISGFRSLADVAWEPGPLNVLIGPNGSGKSTLANVLAGRPEYTVTSGQALYKGQNLLKMEPETRAREGLFRLREEGLNVGIRGHAADCRAPGHAARRAR